MAKVSPWANKDVAPMQAAGALVPLVAARGSRKTSLTFANQLHGTAFFISPSGIFLTAAHLTDPFPNQEPALGIIIINANGMSIMPVHHASPDYRCRAWLCLRHQGSTCETMLSPPLRPTPGGRR
jgi:hypothetical protein